MEVPSALCDVLLFIADDHKDNVATIECDLSAGHAGDHVHKFSHGKVVAAITWTGDEWDESWQGPRCGHRDERGRRCHRTGEIFASLFKSQVFESGKPLETEQKWLCLRHDPRKAQQENYPLGRIP